MNNILKLLAEEDFDGSFGLTPEIMLVLFGLMFFTWLFTSISRWKKK